MTGRPDIEISFPGGKRESLFFFPAKRPDGRGGTLSLVSIRYRTLFLRIRRPAPEAPRLPPSSASVENEWR